MLKKILQAVAAVIAVIVVCAGVYWQLNGKRLQAEYAEFKRSAAPVLMYHAVGPEVGIEWPQSLIMPAQVFEEHLQYLKGQGYHIISVEQLADRLAKGEDVEHYVALSFDDGYKNNHSVVFPLLQKYDAKASFFVINQDIGDDIHMNQDEIKELIAAGMELGSHTTSHAPLAKIDPKYLAWELATSRYYLKKNFDGYIVRTLAYPNGNYNETVISEAQRYGFYRALTGKVGVNTAATYKAAPMEMYRVTVADDGKGAAGLAERIEKAYLWGFLQTKGIDLNIIRDLFL